MPSTPAMVTKTKKKAAARIHVFHKMSKTLLVVIFQDGTYFCYQIKKNPVFGLVVIPDIISEAVGQNAGMHGRIQWNGLGFDEAGRGKRQRGQNKSQDFLLHVELL